jgi:phage shock protein A
MKTHTKLALSLLTVVVLLHTEPLASASYRRVWRDGDTTTVSDANQEPQADATDAPAQDPVVAPDAPAPSDQQDLPANDTTPAQTDNSEQPSQDSVDTNAVSDSNQTSPDSSTDAPAQDPVVAPDAPASSDQPAAPEIDTTPAQTDNSDSDNVPAPADATDSNNNEDSTVAADTQDESTESVDKLTMITSMLQDMKESFDGDISMYQEICNELEEMVADFERNEEIRSAFVANIMNWLSGADNTLATMQNNFNYSILEKDAQIEQLTAELSTAQQNAQQEIASMNDVIAQLNGNLTNLQSSYDYLYASCNGDTRALAESISELSEKYKNLITERDRSLSLMYDLKGTIAQYFDIDQTNMNNIQENLPTLP